MTTKINTPIACGEFATFGFTTDLVEPYRFQWKRNGAHVGRNEKTYTTPPLRPEDFKAKYSVVVTGQDKTEESAEIVLGDVVMKPAAPAAKPPERRTGAPDIRPLPRAERRHNAPDTRAVGVTVQPPKMGRVERRHGAADTRPVPHVERRIGAPDNRPLVAL